MKTDRAHIPMKHMCPVCFYIIGKCSAFSYYIKELRVEWTNQDAILREAIFKLTLGGDRTKFFKFLFKIKKTPKVCCRGKGIRYGHNHMITLSNGMQGFIHNTIEFLVGCVGC